MANRKELDKRKTSAIKRWKDRKRRYEFCRRRLKRILSLSKAGWPRMTLNPDYLKWLDLVYEAKERDLYSINTATCDVIANLYDKAHELKNLKRNNK